MTPLEAHGRIAALCDRNFQDWRLGIDPRSEAQAVAQDDFPAVGATLASLSGGLEDLPDDADDEALLELVRHGIVLFGQRIITPDQFLQEQQAVIDEVLRWGDGIQAEIDSFTRSN